MKADEGCTGAGRGKGRACPCDSCKPPLGRAHDGPMPGSYLITVELEPGTDPDVWLALMTAYRGIAREMVKGDIYVHGTHVMKGMGKHAADEYEDLRLGDQPA